MIKKSVHEFYTKKNIKTEAKTANNKVIHSNSKSGSCVECRHFKYYSSAYGSSEACKHPENVYYTYNYKGKHAHIIWEPKDKNKNINCEFWEKKESVLQKIKARISIW